MKTILSNYRPNGACLRCTLLLACLCSLGLASLAFAQAPPDGNGFFVLEKVTIDPAARSVTYKTNVGNARRTLSYTMASKQQVDVAIKDAQGETLFSAQVTDKGIKGQAGGTPFRSLQGEPVDLPPESDSKALWLFKQDLLGDPMIGVVALEEEFDPALFGPGSGTGSQPEANMGLAHKLITGLAATTGLWDWIFGGGSDNCLNPNQTTTCTEEAPDGAESTIIFECDCGTPMCSSQAFSVDVPLIIVDETTGEQHTETITQTFTKCVCYCLEMNFALPNN